MPKFDVRGPSEIPITIKVSEGMVKALDELALQDHRKRSSVARLLMERGIAAFHRDGSLIEPRPDPDAITVVDVTTTEPVKVPKKRIKPENDEGPGHSKDNRRAVRKR